MGGCNAGGVWFELRESFFRDELTVDSVGLPTLVNFLHAGNFLVVEGHDYLSADIVVDVFLFAKGFHGDFSCTAIGRLEGTRFVVNTGMQDSRVVTRLVLGYAGLLFQNDDR